MCAKAAQSLLKWKILTNESNFKMIISLYCQENWLFKHKILANGPFNIEMHHLLRIWPNSYKETNFIYFVYSSYFALPTSVNSMKCCVPQTDDSVAKRLSVNNEVIFLRLQIIYVSKFSQTTGFSFTDFNL